MRGSNTCLLYSKCKKFWLVFNFRFLVSGFKAKFTSGDLNRESTWNGPDATILPFTCFLSNHYFDLASYLT